MTCGVAKSYITEIQPGSARGENKVDVQSSKKLGGRECRIPRGHYARGAAYAYINALTEAESFQAVLALERPKSLLVGDARKILSFNGLRIGDRGRRRHADMHACGQVRWSEEIPRTGIGTQKSVLGK